MKYATFIICLLFISSISWAQPPNQYQTAKDADPAAKKLLDKMRKQYEGYKAVEANIQLTITIPEQPVEVQKGTMTQSGEKYRVVFEKQHIYCDSEAIWFYQSDVNEVQINSAADLEDDEDMLTPNKLLRIYENDDYVYAMANAYTEDGQPVQEIVFKPLDLDSEYSKLRLKLNTRTYDPVSILVFSKDGTRFELKFDDIKTNQRYAADYFSFKKSDFPGVHIEDLRID